MPDQIIETTEETTEATPKRYRCRHIFIDGRRCGSPSLRGEPFCYYHQATRGNFDDKRYRRSWTEFELPPLEDRTSVLAAIAEVLQRIACGNLPAKQAGLLLYGLQIASNNLPKTDEAKPDNQKDQEAQPVEEVITHPRFGDLAPIAEILEQETPLDSSHISDPEPTILPNLNASTAKEPCHSAPERAERVEGEEPPYFAPACSPTPCKNPTIPLAETEINMPTTEPGTLAWYPSNCHANEKRTSSPPHSAHRHQAAQRRRPRRRHAIDGLQLP